MSVPGTGAAAGDVRTITARAATPSCVLLAAVLAGCGTQQPAEPPPPVAATAAESPAVDPADAGQRLDDGGARDEGHAHAAPHGGAMVELGDHAAHLELVFDPQTGRLTLYVLDGEGTGPIRLNQPHVTLVVGTENEPVFVTLDAAGRVLTGERVGDSSEFRAVAPALVGATSLDARVETVTVRGQTYDNIGIAWRAP